MKRSKIDHFAIAEACRAVPGEWQPVGEYSSTRSAKGALAYIGKAQKSRGMQMSAYYPAGAFEARFELTEMGARVEARYVGSDGLAEVFDVEAGLAEILGTLVSEDGGER